VVVVVVVSVQLEQQEVKQAKQASIPAAVVDFCWLLPTSDC